MTDSLPSKIEADPGIQWAEEFMKGQWERISPVPRSQPGSYDTGYQNGMIDILRGLQEAMGRQQRRDHQTSHLPADRATDEELNNLLGMGCCLQNYHREAMGKAVRELLARRAQEKGSG